MGSGRKALRPEEVPFLAATSHLVNSFGEKTLSQNWSFMNYDVEDDLWLEGPRPTWVGSPGQQSGDDGTHQQALRAEGYAVHLWNCTWTSGSVCTAGKQPSGVCLQLYFIHTFDKAFLSKDQLGVCVTGWVVHSTLEVMMLCAKLLQSCPTFCNTMDCSPPGSSVHGDSPSENTGVG